MSQNHVRRWEYKTLRPPRGEVNKEATDPETELNAHADDGWELVETIDYAGGGTKYLVFARPVEADGGTGTENTGRGDGTEQTKRGDGTEESP